MHKNACIVAVILIAWAGLAWAQQASDGAYIPDVETFLQIGNTHSPGVSDDGKMIFFNANMSGVNQLYRLTEAGWPYQLTVFPDGIDFYEVAPDGRGCVVGASVGGDEQSRLFWIDGITGRPRQLTDKPDIQYGSVMFDATGEGIFYRSNEANGRDFYIYHMMVPEGSGELVYSGEGSHSPGAVTHDGRYLVVLLYHSNENTDLYLVDLEGTAEPRLLTPHEGNIFYYPGGVTADDTRLWLVTNGNADGIMRAAMLDLTSGQITEPLPPTRWEVEGGGMSPDGRFAGLIFNEDGYGRLHIYDLETFEELPAPDLDGIVGDVVFSSNQTALVHFYSPTKAPDIWAWDWRTRELKQLTFTTYAGIDPGLFRDPELVRIKSFDGLEVPAFLYLPAGYKSGEPIPFILHMHGGPESQFRPAFIRNFQYMILNGYGILAPNVRGSSGYGREYMALDNYTLRMNSVKDAGECARWLIDQGYTTSDMLGIRGGSYGGFMVLASITEFPDLFAAAIDNVGIANFQTFLENTRPYRRHLREAEYGPLTDPEFLKSVSPIYKADQIRTPLLVIHGENDPRVPVNEARQIAAAVAAQGGVVDTLIFPDEGHGAAKRPNVLRSYRTQVDFFDTHLKK